MSTEQRAQEQASMEVSNVLTNLDHALHRRARRRGYVSGYRPGRTAPLMRTDRARFIRLLLQPVLVAWALWSTRDR